MWSICAQICCSERAPEVDKVHTCSACMCGPVLTALMPVQADCRVQLLTACTRHTGRGRPLEPSWPNSSIDQPSDSCRRDHARGDHRSWCSRTAAGPSSAKARHRLPNIRARGSCRRRLVDHCTSPGRPRSSLQIASPACRSTRCDFQQHILCPSYAAVTWPHYQFAEFPWPQELRKQNQDFVTPPATVVQEYIEASSIWLSFILKPRGVRCIILRTTQHIARHSFYAVLTLLLFHHS